MVLPPSVNRISTIAWGSGGAAGLVQREQAGEDLVVAEPAAAPALAPDVGVGDGLVEPGVQLVRPDRAEVGQLPLLRDLGGSSSFATMRSG